MMLVRVSEVSKVPVPDVGTGMKVVTAGAMAMIVLTALPLILGMGNDVLLGSMYWDAFPFGTAPVIIDGAIDDGEWNDSTVTVLPAPRTIRIYTKEDTENILIAVECPDQSVVSIALDVDNSGGATPQEGDIMLQLGMNNTEHAGTGTTWASVEKGGDWNASEGISRQYELVMAYGRLGLTPGVPGSFGIFIDITGPLGHDTFPSDGNLYVPNTWASADSSDDWGEDTPFYIPPILEYGRVDPVKGFTDTEFRFYINYTDDVTGKEPVRKDVVIDGVPHAMTTGDDDVTDGATYEHRTMLGPGQHQFHFDFSDGTADLRFPGSGSISGPFVSEPNQPPQLIGGGIPSDTLTIDEDTPAIPDLIDLEDYFTDDRDDGLLTFSLATQQDEVRVEVDGSKLGIIGVEPNWHGSVELTVSALDNGIEGYPVEDYRLETVSGPFRITVLSVNDPPQAPTIRSGVVVIVGGSEFDRGEDALLRASSYDIDTVLDPTEYLTFEWRSDLDGDLGEGESFNVKDLSAGAHTISVTVTDSQGASASSNIDVTVIEVDVPWYEGIEGSLPMAFISAAIVLTVISFIGFTAYTRLKSKSLLDNVNRKIIYEIIRDEPGMYFSQIARRLDLKQGVLSHHLNMLEKHQFIRSLQDGKCRRFYLYDQKVDYRLTLTDVQETILYLITQNPGVTQSYISSTMGRSKVIVNYHIRILRDIGLLSLDRDGRETHCYITGKAEDLLIARSDHNR